MPAVYDSVLSIPCHPAPTSAGKFVMQLISKRLQEFSLFNPQRFKTFEMRERFQVGGACCVSVELAKP